MHLFKSSRMIISFLGSFLIFLASAKPNTTVTDELIDRICKNTRTPSLCLQTLRPLKGNNLLPKPVATLGTKPLDMALIQAHRIHAMIWALHQRIKDSTRRRHLIKQKQRYYKCHLKFSDVRRRLTEAKMAMQEGNSTSVRNYTSMAMYQAGSCEAEFINPPRELSAVAKDIGTFRDTCSIILAICDEVAQLECSSLNLVLNWGTDQTNVLVAQSMCKFVP